ncbi:hypothetical protein Pfo_002390, partial [Paulownia fortunei]
FEDIVWDDFCRSDDHIVPHPSFEQADDHSILGDSHKKPRCEVTSISNNTGDRPAAGYVDQGREHGGFSSLSKRRNTMLEKDSWSHTPSGVFPSSSDNDSIKEASSLASEKTTSSSHAFKSNNTESTGNTLDFFENTEEKDSSDFLYYGWPEIGNFEDVDRMFRSCDSTFGLVASKEDELGWFTSADDIGGSGDVVKSDFEFACPESNPVENTSQNHDSSKSNSINDSAMTSAPTRFKDSSWISEKSDSYMSFVNGPAMANSKDGFIHKEQINEHKKQVKLQNQSIRKRKEQYFGNGSFSYISNLPNEVVQLPLSYMHSDNSPLSDLTSVNPAPSAVKSETNDLTSPSPRDSSHASNQLQSMESSHDPPFPMTARAGSGRREKLHSHQGSRSSVYSSLKNASATVQAAIGDPGLIGKQVHYSGDKSENHSDTEGVSLVIPAELGSSNMQESSTMSSGVDDISQEAASFRQLQLVMEQLDLRTKICIRDSLYRLARSAEQRHNHANLNGSCGDERDASGAFMAEGTNNFMDMETDTNPIDRSIAHLLFHRPSESSAIPAHDSLPFKSPSAVRGSVASPPVMVENLVICEETASEIEKVSDR